MRISCVAITEESLADYFRSIGYDPSADRRDIVIPESIIREVEIPELGRFKGVAPCPIQEQP